MKKIGVWGDSITNGASDKEYGGWVSRLRNHINDSGQVIEVFNLGINGEKVHDILGRFVREYKEIDNPDVVLIAIGINDSPHKNYQGTALDDFRRQYESLISLSLQQANQTVLIGLTNVLENHHRNKKHGYNNKNIYEYNEIIKKLAQIHNLKFVNLWEIITKDDLQKDGLHPEANGHDKIYKQVIKTLEI